MKDNYLKTMLTILILALGFNQLMAQTAFEIGLVTDYQNIRNKAQDTYMRPQDGAPDRKMHQWEATFADAGTFSSYQWELRPATTAGYYYFVNKSTGQIHKPTGESTGDSSLDGSFTLDGTTKDNDFFMYAIEEVDGDPGYYHIKNKASGYYIRPSGGGDDPDGAGALTRNDVQIRHQSATTPTFNSYRWYFVPRQEAGILASNTWDGSAWSNIVAPRYNNVKIDEDYSLATNGSFEANNITVADGKTLTIESGQTLIVHGNLDLTVSGAMVVESGGSLVTKGTVSGFGYTIHRQTTFNSSTGKYSAIGSPITAGSTSLLGSIVYAYDETVAYGSGNQERFTAVTSPETMGVGDAYFSAYTDNVTFVGKPNAGDIVVPLIYDTSNDGGTTNAGFNLVSNPYPSAISYDEFVATNVTENAVISGTIYLWDDGGSDVSQRENGDYIIANSMGAASAGSGRSGDWNGYIGSAQGFFVKAITAGDLNFEDSMRVAGNNENGAYFRKLNTAYVSSFPTVKLSLSNNSTSASMETLIGLASDATLGTDLLYDGELIGGNNGLRFYSLITGDTPYAIQGLPTDFSSGLPLGMEVSGNGGSFTMSLSGLNNWPANLPIMIHDLQTGQSQLLDENSSYTFTSTAGTFNDRFLLFSSANGAVLSEENLLSTAVQYSINGIVLTNHEAQINNIQIHDVAGKLIMQTEVHAQNQSTEISFSFEKGRVYIVKVTTLTGTLTDKIFIQ